jgi:hypothetical protein
MMRGKESTDRSACAGGPGGAVGAGSCAHAPVPHQLQAQDHLHLQPRRTEEPLHRQASRQVTTVLLAPDPVGFDPDPE